MTVPVPTARWITETHLRTILRERTGVDGYGVDRSDAVLAAFKAGIIKTRAVSDIFDTEGPGEVLDRGYWLERQEIPHPKDMTDRPGIQIDYASAMRWIDGSKEKRPGGRRAKYDYEGAVIEAAGQCFNGPLKGPSVDDLTDVMVAWMTERYENGGPDRRELEKRAQRLYDRLFED